MCGIVTTKLRSYHATVTNVTEQVVHKFPAINKCPSTSHDFSPRFVCIKLFAPLLLYEIMAHCCFLNYSPQVCTVGTIGVLPQLHQNTTGHLHQLPVSIRG